MSAWIIGVVKRIEVAGFGSLELVGTDDDDYHDGTYDTLNSVVVMKLFMLL